MTKTTISPLRQRMLDDMALRKLSEQTQRAYIRAVERFTRFFGRSPELASPEVAGVNHFFRRRQLDFSVLPSEFC